jgi:Family of unknown function (DUF6308)
MDIIRTKVYGGHLRPPDPVWPDRAYSSEIPVDVEIVDVDPQKLSAESPAGQLWELLRGARDGVGPTRTSKLLAAKRPRLLPIWDKKRR